MLCWQVEVAKVVRGLAIRPLRLSFYEDKQIRSAVEKQQRHSGIKRKGNKAQPQDIRNAQMTLAKELEADIKRVKVDALHKRKANDMIGAQAALAQSKSMQVELDVLQQTSDQVQPVQAGQAAVGPGFAPAPQASKKKKMQKKKQRWDADSTPNILASRSAVLPGKQIVNPLSAMYVPEAEPTSELAPAQQLPTDSVHPNTVSGLTSDPESQQLEAELQAVFAELQRDVNQAKLTAQHKRKNGDKQGAKKSLAHSKSLAHTLDGLQPHSKGMPKANDDYHPASVKSTNLQLDVLELELEQEISALHEEIKRVEVIAHKKQKAGDVTGAEAMQALQALQALQADLAQHPHLPHAKQQKQLKKTLPTIPEIQTLSKTESRRQIKAEKARLNSERARQKQEVNAQKALIKEEAIAERARLQSEATRIKQEIADEQRRMSEAAAAEQSRSEWHANMEAETARVNAETAALQQRSAAAEISKTNRILAAEKAERKKRTTADKKSKRQVKQSSANANSTDAAITSAQLAGRAKGAALVARLK